MSDEHRLDDIADAILDGAPIDWDEVATRAEDQHSLIDTLKALAALADVHRDSSPPARWGHFTLIEEMGRGAFGRVFRARDTRLDRDVALKILDAPASPDDTRASSIVDEGRLLAQVRHPNVVTIYGAGRIGGEVGLWMELIQGRTLHTLLGGGRAFTIGDVVDIGSQLCDAVAAVHAAGLLHRDIKAANVMLADDGRVVLMDFGTGWEARDSAPAVPAGTPLYLAPELLEGEQPTVSTDIYAVGVLLFLLLTGQYPVAARAIGELKEAHARRERAELRALRPDLSRAHASVIERALDPAAERRHATAGVMAAALRQANRRVSKGLVATATFAAVVVALLATEARRPASPSSSPPGPAETLTGAVRPVTSSPGEKSYPILSPDGSRVAYAWNRNGAWGIYVTEIASGRTRQVEAIEERGSYPRWSPDGRSLAFLSGLVTKEGPVGVLHIAAVDGRQIRTLWQSKGNLAGSGLSWSPDGRQLALSAKSHIAEPYRIMLLDVSTLRQRWVTEPERGGGDHLPAFSPDGAELAFVRSAGQQSTLNVVRLDTGLLRRLSAEGHHVGDMTWSPDGQALIFTSMRAGGKETLWRIPASGGEPQSIAGVGEGARFPSVSLDGRLAYLQQVRDSNIYRADVSEGESGVAQRLVTSTRVESAPDMSPDGSRIAFTSNQSGSQEVWLADADGENPRRLTTLGTTAHPRWSPDGTRLACAVGLTPSASSGSSIHVIDASSGASRPLTEGTALDKWPTWSADGQSIYFASQRSGSWEIWKVSAAGGDPVRITNNGGTKAWESSDGSALYYASESAGRTAIWRMALEGGTPTLVLPLPPDTPWGGEWVLKAEGIYWLNERVGPQIELFSFRTRHSVPVVKPRGLYDHGSGFSVSNDGRWVLFSTMDYQGTDVMMLEPRRR